MQPFITQYLSNENIFEPKGHVITRTLKDMWEMYRDEESAKELLEENPLIYEVFNVVVPETVEHLQHCLTVLYPGKIGSEYYMTKGHYHEIENRAEIYFCFKGKGKLVMQTRDGQTSEVDMVEGAVAYVPPNWAHRTVNTGNEPLVFFAAYPGDAGHDYGEIEHSGFRNLIIEEDNQVNVVQNEKYKS